MSNPWFRMYAEFAGDPIIQSLAFEDQRHFVIILCLKCDGVIDRPIASTTKERIIFRALGLSESAGNEAKKRLIDVRLINEKWQPSGWNRRQFLSDNSTERSRKSRKNKETGNVAATLQQRFCNAPDTETDTETEKEIKTPPAPPAGKATQQPQISFETPAADAAISVSPKRPQDEPLSEAVEILMAYGAKGNAYAVVGSLRKQYDDSQILWATGELAKVTAQVPSPIGFVKAKLKPLRKRGEVAL